MSLSSNGWQPSAVSGCHDCQDAALPHDPIAVSPPAATERSHRDRLRVQMYLRALAYPRVPESSAVLDDVLLAYGEMDADRICSAVGAYVDTNRGDLRCLLDRYRDDPRTPAVLTDLALPCVLERLENDRYALRKNWAPKQDLHELRRVSDLWGIRLGV